MVSVGRGSGGGRACLTVTAQPLGARVPIPCEGCRRPPARPCAATAAPPRDAGSARPASPAPRAGRSMSAASDTYILIKDIKPGLKNLNVIFIVLEIGKWRPVRPTPGSPTRVPRGGDGGCWRGRATPVSVCPPLSRASPPPPPLPPRRASHQDEGRARGEVLQSGGQDGQHHHLRVGRDRRPHPAGGHHPPDQRVRMGPGPRLASLPRLGGSPLSPRRRCRVVSGLRPPSERHG